MQYLTDQQGKPLGVFLTMAEWETFRERCDMSYEEWERRAVQKALDSLAAGERVPDADVRTRFAELGANLG